MRDSKKSAGVIIIKLLNNNPENEKRKLTNKEIETVKKSLGILKAQFDYYQELKNDIADKYIPVVKKTSMDILMNYTLKDRIPYKLPILKYQMKLVNKNIFKVKYLESQAILKQKEKIKVLKNQILKKHQSGEIF